MTVTVFREIKITSTKRFRCACGRRLTRQKKFSQTVNPFNKKENGKVKTPAEILDEVVVAARMWKAVPDACTHAPLAKVPA